MDVSLPISRIVFALGAGILALFSAQAVVQAQPADSAMTELEARLAVQEEEIRRLRERLDKQEFGSADEGGGRSGLGCDDLSCVEGPSKRRVPLVTEESLKYDCCGDPEEGGGPKTLQW